MSRSAYESFTSSLLRPQRRKTPLRAKLCETKTLFRKVCFSALQKVAIVNCIKLLNIVIFFTDQISENIFWLRRMSHQATQYVNLRKYFEDKMCSYWNESNPHFSGSFSTQINLNLRMTSGRCKRKQSTAEDWNFWINNSFTSVPYVKEIWHCNLSFTPEDFIMQNSPPVPYFHT